VRLARANLPAAALAIGLVQAAPAPAADRVEAEKMDVARQAGRVVKDPTASGHRALRLERRGRARISVEAAGEARLRIVVRARHCRGAPRLAVTIDGARVATRRVRARRWRPLKAPPSLAAGAHRVTLRLANPRRGRHCRRAVLVDALESRVLAQPAPPAPAPAPEPPAGGRWIPAPRTTWQWQLSPPVDVTVAAQMFDVDLFDTPGEVVADLHRRGARVVCYFSAGSVEPGRPDSGEFPAAVIGNPLEGWPDERWLDVRRLDVLGPVFERRLDLCRQKGFDGVEADNVDAYANATGFPLSGDDQLAFNRFLARAAHARGLSIALKNDLEQVAALEPEFDFAINEQCFEYGECELLQPFVRAGKAVFVAEYGTATSAFCPQANAAGLMAMRKQLNLDAWREPCW
jgi:Glycoside-hydrolase family GH114